MRQSSRKVKIFVKLPDAYGNRTPRYPLIVPLPFSALIGEQAHFGKRAIAVCVDYESPAFWRWRSLPLCPDRIRQSSASIRGSVLLFQGAGESRHKCLAEYGRANFNHAAFALAFFSRRQDRELPGAMSRGLLDRPCRV